MHSHRRAVFLGYHLNHRARSLDLGAGIDSHSLDEEHRSEKSLLSRVIEQLDQSEFREVNVKLII